MTKNLFIWERQSTIHLLFIPLEAAMEPLRKYFGQGWPDTYLIYNKNIVKWVNDMEKLKSLGQKAIDFYIKEKNIEKMLADLKNNEKKLVTLFDKLEKTELPSIDDSSLKQLYNILKMQYIDWYKIGWLVEPVSLQAEDLLKEITKNQKEISILTTPIKESFSKRELKELLKIADKKSKGKKINSELKKHAKEYFWLQNNYFKTTTLTKEYFEKQIQQLIEEHPNPGSYLTEIELINKKIFQEKKEILSKLNLSKKQKEIIKLVELFGWFQDYRKEFIMKANHYLTEILREIGNRKGFTLEKMYSTFPKEIRQIFESDFDKKKLENRVKNCLIIQKEFYNNCEFYTGKEAKDKEKELLKDIDNPHQIFEFSGRSANSGIRRGTAFVTFDPKEAEKIKAGSILVTSMTSPDFIIGMKNALAIVTDEGGITSHAAILAREFGVPCVVGTKIATKAIKTGDLIEVDGNHGFVRKLT